MSFPSGPQIMAEIEGKNWSRSRSVAVKFGATRRAKVCQSPFRLIERTKAFSFSETVNKVNVKHGYPFFGAVVAEGG